MLQSISGNSFLILSVLIFVAVTLLLEGLYITWKSYKGPEAQKVQRRLQALSAARDKTQQGNILKQRMINELSFLDRALLRVPRARWLDRLIVQAGLDWTVSKLLFWCAALAALSALVTIVGLHQQLLMGISAAVLAGAAPLVYVNHLRTRRLGKLEQQLPEALDLMTRALRAGHAFSSALKMVGDEMPEPLANEFRIVHDEINFGVSMQQALTNISERIPLTDLRYFVVAVLIQRDSGGNLTEILSNLSHLIRERLKLLAKVRVLSSEGRLSAWILGVMPFALAGLMNLVNPKFMSPLWTDPIGITIVKYMLILMAIGAVILRKIVRIRV